MVCMDFFGCFLLTVIFSVVLFSGKGSNLVSGFNTMSEDKKDYIIKKK